MPDDADRDWDVRVETCRVGLWRGYLTASFTATLIDGPGNGTVVDSSSSFRWRRADPPDTEEARLAHYELLSRLQEGGWTPSAEGDPWYAAELSRPTMVPREEETAEPEPAPAAHVEPEHAGEPEPEPEPEPVVRAVVERPRTAEPEPEPQPQQRAAALRPHDRWRIAALVGLVLAIAFLAVLVTHA
jgi:hypothetical protein